MEPMRDFVSRASRPRVPRASCSRVFWHKGLRGGDGSVARGQDALATRGRDARDTWRASFVLCVLAACAPSAAAADSNARAGGGEAALAADWLAKVSAKHPRMFLTAESLPAVRDYTLKHEKDYYEAMKKRVAAWPAKAEANTFEKGANVKYGPYAQQAAFVWLMERDRSALDKAKNYLQEGLKFYLRQSGAGKPVNWYSADRVCALTTYDWIHDQLTPEERRQIAQGFFQHLKEDLAGKGEGFDHSDYKTGFYGSSNLPWYIGLAFHRDGIDDEQAAKLLQKGYDEHIQLLRYRQAASGDDGGAGSLAVGYAFGMYPFTEFNFIHTFDSATGLAMEKAFPYPSLLANWVYWNRLADGLRWGLADSVPAGRESEGSLELQMLQIAHFWGRDYPDRAGFALWLREKVFKDRRHDDYWWPLTPLLLTRAADVAVPADAQTALPHARNFESMGLVFMRSGSGGPADAYAAFVAGGQVNQHRHYDQGHFIIYRGGFLAIDSGDYGPRDRNDHLCEYMYRSVAHNCVLIHAPPAADAPAKVWGGPAKTLDGGQCEFAGRQAAFETSASYSYAAADATKCYAPAKCKEAIRQFVFIYPDTFVICDRVAAARPEYAKTWLLHTVNEPQIIAGGAGVGAGAAAGTAFRAEQGDGALICRTVLPRDAVLEKIGGNGKEFWSAGANHPQVGQFKELAGSWRVEVSPKAQRAADVFVHVIRVGDKTLKDFDAVEAVEGAAGGGGAGAAVAGAPGGGAAGRAGVKIKTPAGEAIILFDTAGEPGGHITLPGPQKTDQELTRKVQPQSGLGNAKP